MTNKEIFPHPLSVHNYILRIRGGSSLYLESGVLDLLEIAPLNANSYRVAQLYFDDDLLAYSLTDKALMGEITINSSLSIIYDPPLTEGQSETGVGFKKGDMSDTAVGTFSGVFVNETQVFHSAEAEFRQSAFNRKEAQVFFPPSVFGGKMRLYVQSIYGSKRTDYSYTPPFIGEPIAGTLSIDGEDYTPYLSTTSYWIYTTDEYEYFLMSISGGGISARKLEPSDKGERLRKWLVKNSLGEEETRRAEAYILSTTSVGDSVTVAEAADIAPANSHGSSVKYGWHFNMSGTEGHVVAIKSIDEHSSEATHLKMLVSLDTSRKGVDEFYWQSPDNWTFTPSVQEGPTEFTLGISEPLWNADPIFPGMERLAVSEIGDPMIDADVPVYVIYNYVDDDFDVIRHKRDSSVTHVGRNVSSGSDVSTLKSENGCNVYTTATGASHRGFYVEENQLADARAYDASTVTGSAVEVRLGEFLGCSSGEAFYTCHGGQAGYTGSFTFVTQLTIPVGDMDSIVLGGKLHFDGDVDWLDGTAGTTHNHIQWDSCVDDSPVGSHAIDWLDPFFPSTNQRGSFVSRLRIDGLSGGTAVEGEIEDGSWDELWVVHLHNGDSRLVHEDRVSSDDGGANGVYLPRCLDFSPYSAVADDGASFPVGSLDQGGWDTHFALGGFDPMFNANGVSSKTNVTGDYFMTDLNTSAVDWESNSYSDLTGKKYLTFVGHD